MKNKFMPLMIFSLLISFSAISQTTDPAAPSKLDAFRQMKANTQAVNDSISAASTTASTNVIDNSTPSTTTSVANGAVPKKTSAPTAVITSPSPTPVTQTPALAVPSATPQQPHIYVDTRLGSSTPQYDTYEKNNYGAGSVTTSPK